MYWVFPIHVVYFVILPIQYNTIQYYEKTEKSEICERKTKGDEEEEEKHS